jgi:hypothetical protein
VRILFYLAISPQRAPGLRGRLLPQRQTVIERRKNSSDEMIVVKIAPFFALRILYLASEACTCPFSVQISLTGNSKNAIKDAGWY